MIALGRATMVGALAVWFAVVGNAPAEPPSEIVRADWYFRESLGAIADWETILARLEGTVPAEESDRHAARADRRPSSRVAESDSTSAAAGGRPE